MRLDAGSQDSATDIQEQLHQADSPSVESCPLTAVCINFERRTIPRDAATSTIARIASLTVFIIFGVVYLITAVVYKLIRNVRKDSKCLKVVWFVDIAYAIGGILYYVGKNIPFSTCSYYSCGQIIVTKSILLGTAVVLYRFIPFFISKYYQSKLPFPPLGRCNCSYRDAENAPTHCGSEARNVVRP